MSPCCLICSTKERCTTDWIQPSTYQADWDPAFSRRFHVDASLIPPCGGRWLPCHLVPTQLLGWHLAAWNWCLLEVQLNEVCECQGESRTLHHLFEEPISFLNLKKKVRLKMVRETLKHHKYLNFIPLWEWKWYPKVSPHAWKNFNRAFL